MHSPLVLKRESMRSTRRLHVSAHGRTDTASERRPGMPVHQQFQRGSQQFIDRRLLVPLRRYKQLYDWLADSGISDCHRLRTRRPVQHYLGFPPE